VPTYKNQFGRPKYYDHEILDENGKKLGTLRVKPGRVLWKKKGEGKFHSVSLDKLVEWITGPDSGASRTKS
jgi:hypothetical protein